MSSPIGSFLSPAGYAGPRGLGALVREGSTVVESVRMVGRLREERRIARERPYVGEHRTAALDPVLLVPGFMAADGTLALLAAQLRRRGWRTYRSHIGVNMGCTRAAADRLERRLEMIADRRGSRVTIVGHSLGGMLARGLAARRPDLVEGIVALGSPVLAPGAVHSALAWDAQLLTRLTKAGLRGMMSEDCLAGDCARLSWEETQSPLAPGLPFTAIYSRRDGIVDWKACLDPAATHVEVSTSHCGMAVDPLVMDQVLHALRRQQPSG